MRNSTQKRKVVSHCLSLRMAEEEAPGMSHCPGSLWPVKLYSSGSSLVSSSFAKRGWQMNAEAVAPTQGSVARSLLCDLAVYFIV